MMFRVALLSALFAGTSAADLASDSSAGKKIMSSARALNQQYEEDLSWLSKFSIKFQSCHSIHSWGGQEGAEEGSAPHSSTHLVNFQLCPSSNGCNSCSGGGEYVVELREFVEAYTEAKEEQQQAQCEAVEENCNCNYYNGDDQACLAGCYKDAGLDFCGDDENQFDVAEFMECQQAEFGNYYNQFYIGPVCSSNGKSIHLQVFTDATCTTAAPSGTYEKYNYNYALPYSKDSLVDNNCISCKEEDENANNNNNNNNAYYQYQEPEVNAMCEELYEGSAKCEKNLKYKNSAYRDTGSCDYIQKILPVLEKVYHKNGSTGGAATAFAVLFGLSTVGASAAAYYFYSKVERTTVDLSETETGAYA